MTFKPDELSPSNNSANLGLSQQLRPSISSHVLANVTASPLLFTFIALIILSLITRIYTGLSIRKTQNSSNNAGEPIPFYPYWVPGIGHIPLFIYNRGALLDRARKSTSHGIFALNLGGTTQNVIATPDLSNKLFRKKDSEVGQWEMAWVVMKNVFGVSNKFKAEMIRTWSELHACVMDTLIREPYLGEMLNVAIQGMQEKLPNMISFTSNEIDQSYWERSSDAELRSVLLLSGKNGEVVEASLWPLIRNLMGIVATPSIMGQAFIDNCPSILDDLWTLDRGFIFLAMGIPRWIPIPSCTKAHIARRRIIDELTSWVIAMHKTAAGEDPGYQWQDMSDVSDMMKRRQVIFKSSTFPARTQAHIELAILWALNVNSNGLTYWLLLRILSTPNLLPRILSEISPYAIVSQPPPIGTIFPLPVLKLSHTGLVTHCPLFKASYLEANRLHSEPWPFRSVNKDTILTEEASDVTGTTTPQSFLLKKGSYASLPQSIHNKDSRFWDKPNDFVPERFLATDADGKTIVDAKTLRPYGGGATMCKGRVFAERECLAFVAGVLVLWDIQPVGTKGWQVPGHIKTSAVCLPKGDTKVWIRRREVAT